jgi:hypothetical protein
MSKRTNKRSKRFKKSKRSKPRSKKSRSKKSRSRSKRSRSKKHLFGLVQGSVGTLTGGMFRPIPLNPRI